MSTSTSYDPRTLVADVAQLLEERGVTVDREHGTVADRSAGAGMLLRGLGVEPLASPEDTLDLDGGTKYNSRLHGD